MSDEYGSHYNTVVAEMKRGKVIPFLGSGANLCGRPEGASFKPGGKYLPSGEELAQYLAENFGYQETHALDLVRVAEYVALMTGSGALYEELRRLFDADYAPTALHELLASTPELMRQKGYPAWPQIVVTTNYDDVLERALREAREPFDLVVYMTVGDYRGKFLHFLPDGDLRVVDVPNEYRGLPLDDDGNLPRPVILKIHGAVDRSLPERDSFVITEDHYIDYLTHTDISSLVPAPLPAKLKRSNFLFLGYSLRDWNLRVILHRIWGEQHLTFTSWAIQFKPGVLDKKFWQRRDVEILAINLDDYVRTLKTYVEELPAVERIVNV